MADIKLGLRLLETLTSALYDDPIILFREYVQNSVDAYNEAIDQDAKNLISDFCVEILIDDSGRNITISDNGYGIVESEFQQKMTSIGASEKGSKANQIGFRGIGRLSAMPFCQKLIFKNKPKGSNKVLIYTWDGSKFNDMLDKESETELSAAIEQISSFSEIKYTKSKDDHFFTVEIHSYNEEIVDLITRPDFIDRLKMTLPLQYDPSFKTQTAIKKKYLDFMGEPLDKFSFDVKLNGQQLYKPYKESNILESGIHFWELRYLGNDKGVPGDKLGLLWFTFNRKVTANPTTEPYGILVRSKNMLVGDHNTLADVLSKSKDAAYIATHRELTQTLQGVYGEMLINSPDLRDNARRDWFRIDSASIQLRDIITNFMKHLFGYRKTASRAFNAIENDKNKERLVHAFSELTSNYKPDEHIKDFYDKKRNHDIEKEKNIESFVFASEDIPYFPVTLKRFYDRIIGNIRGYYTEKDDIKEFLKLRSHLKRKLTEEQE